MEKGGDQGNGKGENDRDDVKSHLPFLRLYILKKDTVSEIDDQKQKDWKKRFGIRPGRRYFRLIHVQTSLCD